MGSQPGYTQIVFHSRNQEIIWLEEQLAPAAP